MKKNFISTVAMVADTNILIGIANHTDIPSLINKVDATYAPSAEITPCAKFVVNDVLKISVIAIVTSATTHILVIVPKIVSSKYPILTPSDDVSCPSITDTSGYHTNNATVFYFTFF